MILLLQSLDSVTVYDPLDTSIWLLGKCGSFTCKSLRVRVRVLGDFLFPSSKFNLEILGLMKFKAFIHYMLLNLITVLVIFVGLI